MNKEEEHFLKNQKLYNESGDIKYIWELFDDFCKVAEACIVKLYKGAKKDIRDLEDKKRDVALALVKRYVNDRNYHKDKFATLIYLTTQSVVFNKKSMTEDRNMSLDEHFENLSYTENEVEDME